MTPYRTALAAGLIVACAVLAPGMTAAADRQIASQAVNYCQSALPVFDGSIRKRPLAVQNEGTGTAFVTCSYPSGEGRGIGGSVTTQVWQYFISNADDDLTVNCTGVSGVTLESAQFIAKNTVLPAGASSVLVWSAEDFAGDPAVFPSHSVFSISCSLPPGAGLRQSYVNSDENVGT